MIDVREEQIKLLCKQLKLPTFANYTDILRQSQPGADFGDLLLNSGAFSDCISRNILRLRKTRQNRY